MILDFIGENINGTQFSCSQHFPSLYADCSYEIGIKQIILKTKEATLDSLWMLTTNLIDRCSANPNQSLSYFALEKLKYHFIINFSSVDFFRLERIHAYPTFELKNVFGSQKLEISDVIIRAEIRKTCLVSANPSNF